MSTRRTFHGAAGTESLHSLCTCECVESINSNQTSRANPHTSTDVYIKAISHFGAQRNMWSKTGSHEGQTTLPPRTWGKSILVNTVFLPKNPHVYESHVKTLVASLCLPGLCMETGLLYPKDSTHPSLSIQPSNHPCRELLLHSVHLHQMDQTVMCSQEWGWEIHFCTVSTNPNCDSFLSCGSSRYSAGSIQLAGIKSISKTSLLHNSRRCPSHSHQINHWLPPWMCLRIYQENTNTEFALLDMDAFCFLCYFWQVGCW